MPDEVNWLITWVLGSSAVERVDSMISQSADVDIAGKYRDAVLSISEGEQPVNQPQPSLAMRHAQPLISEIVFQLLPSRENT
jgi:hypothetical protein